MFARTKGAVHGPNLQRLKFAALVGLLAFSALSVAFARSHAYWWVGWVALFPLFISIRILPTAKAMLAGGLWGFFLFVSLVTMADGVLSPSVASLALLTGVPAIYTGFGARLTRRIGFSPLLLALGWLGVELALSPLGLREGLLPGTQGGLVVLHWVGEFAGCALVAFLVAYVSALALDAISRVRVATDGPGFAARSSDSLRRLVPQESFSVLSHLLRRLQPRAPPFSAG